MTYRKQIEAALVYSGGTHTYEDVMERIAAGKMQIWPGPNSVIVTEIIEYPRKKALHFFLAGGNVAELEVMYPGVEAWGRDEGCTVASMAGRPGWTRSFLSRKEGWKSDMVVMEKDLTNGF